MNLSLFLSMAASAQSLLVFPVANAASLRGLSAVSDNILWVSGSGGTVGRSLNGGRFIDWLKIPGYSRTDFRDIHAFNDSEVVIMGITDPAVILRTTNAGKSWTNVLEDKDHGSFFDAMDFSGDNGILIGDPVARKPVFARTIDRGAHWTMETAAFSLADTAEAFFAASGSNVLLNPDGTFLCVSGGTRSFLYNQHGKVDSLPLMQGGHSTGANAIARDPADTGHFYIVGGDFSRDSITTGNAAAIRPSPFATELPAGFPSGYKSSVCYVDGRRLVACGTSGVDVSADGGNLWQKISSRSFHVCGKSRSGNKVFLAGNKGAIGVLEFR